MEGITSLEFPELVAIGQPLRISYLLQQAGYTFGIAAADGPALAALLAANFIPNLTDVRDKLAKSQEDKVVREAEAKLATGTQNEAARLLKVWSRKSSSRAKGARRAGAIFPDDLLRPIDVRAIPDMLTQARKLLALLTEHAPTLDAVGAPTKPLIDEGKTRYDALVAADNAQELSRSATVPAAVSAFYAMKGTLYIGLKIINDAGHELYAHDPQAASRYNLSILHRRHGSSTAEPTPPAPTPPAPTPATTTAASP